MRYVPVALLLWLGFSTAIWAQSPTWHEVQKIVASDRVKDDFFGESVAISGDYAIVGSPGYDVKLSDAVVVPEAGAVYIYKRDRNGGWSQVQRLTASGAISAPQYFGTSVAISGDYAIVGAKDKSTSVGDRYLGGAYIFKRDSTGKWTEVQKIAAKYENKQLGKAVAISGDFAFVTDPEIQQFGLSWGYLYVYQRGTSDEWKLLQTFTLQYGPFLSTGVGDLRFGSSISTDGEHVFVGAPSESTNEGAVYVLKQVESGQWAGYWDVVQKLYSSDVRTDQYFGSSLSVSGTSAIVGSQASQVHVFNLQDDGKWKEVLNVTPTQSLPNAYFGTSVSVSGNVAIISEDAQSNRNVAGAAWVLRRDGNDDWGELERIAPASPNTGEYNEADLLRFAVAVDGNNALVGVRGNDFDESGQDSVRNAGAVYDYEFSSVVGLVEQTLDHPVSSYPNPFQRRLNVDLGEFYPEIDLIVRDVGGIVVLQRKLIETRVVQFDIECQPGVYFLELRTPNNKSAILKLVKS